MAPNVTLHIFRDNDLIGTPLAVITDEDEYFKSLKINPQRDGLGSGEVTLARIADLSALDGDSFRAEYFVRLIISAYSDTVYYPWGFSFTKRQLVTVHKDEDGAEEFRLGGPGPKHYLDRAIMGIGSPSTGWALDLQNGEWRFGESASAGKILLRAIQQDQNEDDPALPDLTTTFTASDDSDGDPWSDTDLSGSEDLYTIPIGTSLLKILWDLDDIIELTSWIDLGSVASPKFELNVIEGLGDDNMGAAFGAGVCLLKEGVNIANDSLETEGITLKKTTHVVVEGRDGVWVEVERPGFVPGSYVKRAKIEFKRTKNEAWLEKAGLRWLRKQDYGEKEVTVEILPGTSDTTGLYFPAPDRVLWLSNLISVKTSADGGSTIGHLDFQHDEEQLVTGFELALGPAGETATATAKTRSWDVKVHLNKQRSGTIAGAPNQGSASSHGDDCSCNTPPRFPPECIPDPGVSTVVDWDWTAGSNPSYVDAFSGGAPANPWGSGVSNVFGSSGDSSQTNHNTFSARFSVTPGQTLLVSWKNAKYGAGAPTTSTVRIRFFTSDGTTIVSNVDQVLATGVASNNHGGYANWQTGSGEYLVPATAAYARIAQTTWSLLFTQRLTITVASADPLQPAECLDYLDLPHASAYTLPADYLLERFRLLEEAMGELELASLQDVDITTTPPADGDALTYESSSGLWVPAAGGSGGAPTTADYLVGTAQAGLSAEIVVGTSPGGELGGTWASPTVDATHSGSAHHAEDHHTRHEAGGADKIKLDDLEPPDDNTDLNASTSKHGLLKKLPNDATKYLDGAGNFTDPGLAGGSTGNVIATPSGSVITIPGLGLGDRKPASAGTYDEEFDGTADTLPTNWAWTSAPSGSDTWKLNSRWPSLLTVEGTGNADYTLSRSSFSPGASTAFGIWCKAHIGPFVTGDRVGFRMYCSNSGETEQRGVNFRASGSHNPAVRGLKIISSAESAWFTEIVLGRFFTTLYMGMTRDASDLWTMWVSQDGIGWDRMDNAAQSHSFTVAKLRFLIQTSSVQGIIGLDWIRYRTDTAFPRP